MLEPRTAAGEKGTDKVSGTLLNAIIIEFKVQDEEELSDTVQAALRQIDEKDYQEVLLARGISAERIRAL